MAIVNFRLPSGWIPVEESITNLTNDENVKLKRYEINENKIALYFDEVKHHNHIKCINNHVNIVIFFFLLDYKTWQTF